MTIETNTFHQGATSGPVPFENQSVELANVTVRLPWTATAGARYAAPLPATVGASSSGRGDPVDTELWDVEVDASYIFAARTGKASVKAGQDVTVVARNADGTGGMTVVPREDLGTFELDRHLLDSFTVRLGGSYAVLPRVAQAQAGVFYESRGVDPAYADVDNFAFQRLGLGVGFVLRLGDFDLTVGYSHIFSETLEVAPPPHQNLEDSTPGDPQSGFDQRVGGAFDTEGTRQGGVVLRDPDAPAPEDADAIAAKTQRAAVATTSRPNRVTNAGRYTASFNVVSVGVVYHF
jgi:hypothetical protein